MGSVTAALGEAATLENMQRPRLQCAILVDSSPANL